MGEKKYLLADVSKKLDVPSYMLRYFEDTLAICIPKDERGLRYYTRHEIELLSAAIMLNRKGFSMGELKLILNDIHRIKKLPPAKLLELKDRLDACTGKSEIKKLDDEPAKNELKPAENGNDKMTQFKNIMTQIMLDALKINNDELVSHLSYGVSDLVVREVGCMISKKEDADEERFKQVDKMLREVCVK